MPRSQRLIQIRTCRLAPDAREAFHRAFVDEAVPMLHRWRHEVVAFGPSPHADDACFLVRAHDDLDDLTARQDAFYASPEWRQGPREGVLAMIRHSRDAVLWASPDAIDDLRRRNPGDAARPWAEPLHARQHPPERFRPGSKPRAGSGHAPDSASQERSRTTFPA